MISAEDVRYTSAVEAITNGDVETLATLIKEHPELGSASIDQGETQDSLLHAATNWPGHFPSVAESIKLIIDAGADVNVRITGDDCGETPLLWAASSNDVVAIDALVDAGADLELEGSVTDGGTALSAAVNFGNWEAAHRLVERGAKAVLYAASALGMMDRVEQIVTAKEPSIGAMNYAFWMACSTGETQVVEYLHQHGANLNWIPDWEPVSALDIATKNEHLETATWLSGNGAKAASECE